MSCNNMYITTIVDDRAQEVNRGNEGIYLKYEFLLNNCERRMSIICMLTMLAH